MSSAKLPAVKKTPALNRFLNFLQEYKGNNDGDDGSLLVDAKEVVDQHVDDKYLFHLALVICVSDEGLEKVCSEDENEDIISCLIDPEDAPRISIENYCDIVTELGLVEESLCMMLANPRMQVMTEIAAGIADKIIKKEGQLEVDLYDGLLTNLVKLARLDDGDEGNDYSASFRKILDWFMKSTVVEKHEKLALVFRLSGISLLQFEDSQPLQDEIKELWKEWSIDKNDYAGMKSTKLFEALFGIKAIEWTNLPGNWKILGALDKFVPNLIFSDQDLTRLEATCSASEINLLNFIGGCAYITKILLQNHFANISTNGDISALRQSVEEWANKKPKTKVEDFVTESRNFMEFCKRMEEHGNRAHSQTDWLQNFLSFTPEDIFMAAEGLQIAEKFIVTSSELGVIQDYVKMAFNAHSFDLSDDVKKLILKIFTDNETVVSAREKVIQAVFENGVNGKFRTGEFFCSLSTIGMQIGTIELQEDPEQIKKNIASVTVIALQDPGPTLTKLLEQSIRSKRFRALEYARPFFCLPNNVQNEIQDWNHYEPILVNQSFNVLLKTLIYPSPLSDSMLNSIDLLISKNVLKAECIYKILKYQILKDLKRNKVFLSKIVGLVVLLGKLVEFLLTEAKEETELLTDICKFVIRLNRFFTFYTNVSTVGLSMQTRNNLTLILQKLLPVCNEKISSVNQETLDGLEDLTTLEIGFLYIRNQDLRSIIENLFLEENFGENLLRDPNQLLTNIIGWILNSCEAEWAELFKFLFEILLKPNTTFKQRRNKLCTLNQVLTNVYSISLDLKSPEIFLHVFKFYLSAIDLLKQKGDIQDVDRNDSLDTLVLIGFMMSCTSERHKEVVGLHQVLMFLLDMVEEAINGNYKFDKSQKLVSNLNRYKELDSKCQSIRWLILKKLEDRLESLTP